jgi:hypothetical protein
MRDTRVLPTVVIWLAMAGLMSFIIGVLAATDSEIEWWGAVLLFFLVVTGIEAAVKSTQAIWKADSAEAIPAAKAKRRQRDRITRLVDSLDDDDIFELEALLLARDHEEVYDNGRRS